MSVQPILLLNQKTSVNVMGGLHPMGAFDAGVTYAVGDSVDYLGSSYIMFALATAGTLPTNTTYWEVLANEGATGATGSTGATGATGATGSAGANGRVLNVVAGANITVDATDPANPIVAATSQVKSDWNASSGVTQILNKPSLATVATSGSHTDLSNIGTNTHPQIDTALTILANTSGTNTGDQNLSGLFISAGEAGGQTATGDTASGGNLTLSSTSNATKGKIFFGTSAYDEVNNRLGIGTASPIKMLSVNGAGLFGGNTSISGSGMLQVQGDGSGYIQILADQSRTYGLTYQYTSPSGVPTFVVFGDYYSGSTAPNLVFGTYSYKANQLVLANTGNVGIGTTSPGSQLTLVKADSSGLTDFLINPTAKTSGNLLDLQVAGVSKANIDNTGKANFTSIGIIGGGGGLTAPNVSVSSALSSGTADVTLNIQTARNFTGANNAVKMSSGTFSGGTGILQNAVLINPTYNQTSTAGATDLLINRTETAIGSGTQRLISAGTGGGSYVEKFGVDNLGRVINSNVVRLKGYTVATLPAGTQGDTCYCTDLLTPTFLALAVGGGVIVGPVFYNGTQWVTN